MLNTEDKVVVGHRYNCLYCLSVYAAKCKVSFDELKRDAYGFLDRFEAMTTQEDNHFTQEDVEAALKGYNEEFCTMTVKTISRLSGITIKKSTRKGRRQDKHLAGARAIQNIDDPEGIWRWKGGKSPCQTTQKKELVKVWRAANPTGTKAACARDLRITYVTVSKHWGSENNHRERVQEWRAANPTGTKAECARAIGLSRPTISKYW